MRIVTALVLILLAAPLTPARAENVPGEKEPRSAIARTAGAAPAAPSMVVTQVKIPSYEAALAEALAAQDMPRRGSFWWLVGVIVVAGVILAVLVS